MEVKAENLQQLAAVFAATLNGDAKVRGPAEDKLKSLRDVPGFHSCLLALVHAHTLAPVDVRLGAAIHFKNDVPRFFARVLRDKSTPNPHDPEKKALCARLLDAATFKEPDMRIAKQLALAVGLVARQEWPHQDWPQLFPQLLTIIQTQDHALVQHRGLLLLAEAFRQLRSMRFVFSKAAFIVAAATLVNFVRTLWGKQMATLLGQVQAISGGGAGGPATKDKLKVVNESAERLEFSTEALHEILAVIPKPHENADTKEYFMTMPKLLQPLLAVRNAIPPDQPLHKHLSEVALLLASTVLNALREDPLSWRAFAFPYFDWFWGIIKAAFTAKGELAFPDLTVSALNYLSRLLSNPQYRGIASISFNARDGMTSSQQAGQEAKAMLDAYMTPARVKELVTFVVTRLFLLRPSDLQQWKHDPEAFVNSEKLSNTDEVRPAAADLLEKLFEQHSDVTAAIITDMLQGVFKAGPLVTVGSSGSGGAATGATATATGSGSTPASPPQVSGSGGVTPAEQQAILAKDALYYAIGMGAHVLPELFAAKGLPFVTWFEAVLSKELSSTHPALAIVRRRVLWLLAAWVEAVPEKYLKPLYGAFASFLTDKHDLVLRVEAVRAITAFVKFVYLPGAEQLFAPYVEAMCTALFAMLDGLEEQDSQKEVLDLVRDLVSRSRAHMKNVVPKLLSILSAMWQKLPRYDHMRQEIVRLLQVVVDAFGPDSLLLQPVVAPVLAFGLDPADPNLTYLQKDCLDLWLAAVQSTPLLTPELAKLFPFWLAIRANGNTEVLDECFGLLRSYTLAGKADFVKAHGANIAAVCAVLMGSNNKEGNNQPIVHESGMRTVCAAMGIIAQCFPKEFPALFAVPIKLMVKHMSDLKADNDQAGVTAATVKRKITNRKDLATRHTDRNLELRIAQYFNILARLFYQNPEGTLQLLTPDVACAVLDMWMDRLQDQLELYNRKLSCLGMLNAVCVKHDGLLGRLEGVLGCVLTVLSELDAPDLNPHRLRPDASTRGDRLRDAKRDAFEGNTAFAGASGSAAAPSSPAPAAPAVMFPEVLKIPPQLHTETQRYQLLVNADPANAVHLRTYTLGKLGQLQQALGPAAWAALRGKLSPDVMHQLQPAAAGAAASPGAAAAAVQSTYASPMATNKLHAIAHAKQQQQQQQQQPQQFGGGGGGGSGAGVAPQQLQFRSP